MKLALYGPTGIGKSSVLTELRRLGLDGLDMDYVWSLGSRARREIVFAISQSPHNFVITGMTLEPSVLSKFGFSTILLYSDQTTYERRRDERDVRHGSPNSSVQGHQTLQWLEAQRWDAVLDTSGADAIATAHHILDGIQKEKDGHT